MSVTITSGGSVHELPAAIGSYAIAEAIRRLVDDGVRCWVRHEVPPSTSTFRIGPDIALELFKTEPLPEGLSIGRQVRLLMLTLQVRGVLDFGVAYLLEEDLDAAIATLVDEGNHETRSAADRGGE